MNRNHPITDIANELMAMPPLETFSQFTARTNAAIERVVGLPGSMAATSNTRTIDGMALRMQQGRLQLWRIEQELARTLLARQRELRNFGGIALQYLGEAAKTPVETRTTGPAARQVWEPPALRRLEIDVPVKPRAP